MEKPSLFFFDDKRKAPSSDWDVARTVEEAKDMLKYHNYGIISLDHDIGYEMACPKCLEEEGLKTGSIIVPITLEMLERGCSHFEDGTDLANWMVANLVEWPALIIIHSGNAVARERMKSILEKKAPATTTIHVEFYSLALYSRIRY